MRKNASETDEIRLRAARHAQVCRERNFPLFAPTSGRCFNCSKQIFEIHTGEEPVTSCPFCNHSFCD